MSNVGNNKNGGLTKLVDKALELKLAADEAKKAYDEVAEKLREMGIGHYEGTISQATVYATTKTTVDVATFHKSVTPEVFLSCVSVKVTEARKALGETLLKSMSDESESVAVRVERKKSDL